MKILTTPELKAHIEMLYGKVKPFAEKEEIFKPLDLYFDDKTPQMSTGEFCYSDGSHYYHGNVGDRGKVTLQEVDNLFDLSYKIFRNRTFRMGIKYLGKYLVTNEKPQDHRRITFPKEIELMRLIGEDYAERLEKEFEEILKEYPYKD